MVGPSCKSFTFSNFDFSHFRSRPSSVDDTPARARDDDGSIDRSGSIRSMVDGPVVGDPPGGGPATGDENAMRSVPALKPKCVFFEKHHLIDVYDVDVDAPTTTR